LFLDEKGISATLGFASLILEVTSPGPE